MFVRKVTKIDKSETPPPTTWPKAGGVHTPRCYGSFPFQFVASYAGAAGRRATQEAPPTVLAVGCLVSGQEATLHLDTITTSTTTYSTFKVFKVLIVKSKSLLFFLWFLMAEVFSARLHFPEITWQSNSVGGNCVNSILRMKGG